MKRMSLVGLLGIVLLSAACAPSASQLKKAMKENPDILFETIKEHPLEFMEVVQAAARDAQVKAQSQAADEEKKKLEEEFTNPKKPVIADSRAVLGNKNAQVTIVEYSDFECPYCARGYSTVKKVMQEYGDKVRLVFKHLPLDFHKKAEPAARYFEAIALQSADKAYKWHDLIFENQDRFKAEGEAYMKEAAKKVGADLKKLAQDLESQAVKDIVQADIQEAQSFEISGTPGFVINGVTLRGAYPVEEFKKIIDRHLSQK